MKAVSDILGVEKEDLMQDIISHNFVIELVETEIVSKRLDGKIANEGLFSDVPTIVNEKTGKVYYTEVESAALRIKDRIHKRRDQIYRQLLATPEMAEKYKRKEQKDTAAKTAELVQKLEHTLHILEKKHITQAEVVDSNVDD
jgi:hypothetical protein